MRSTQMQMEAQDFREEMVVYLVFSPKWGPGYRLYTDEDIQVSGGIHGIERVLEEESYWFARLGKIWGELGPHGVTFHDSEIAKLPAPLSSAWQIGRSNPAFAGPELGRQVFRSTFQGVERMLDSWKREQNGTVEAYTLKELKIGSDSLVSLTNALHSLQKVHDIVEITVMKYWYDPLWSETHLPSDDVILAEYSFHVPVEMRWSAGEDLIGVEVLQMSLC
jgi:hypothetical protein